MNKGMRRRICALISSYIVLIGCYLSSCHKNDVAYNTNYEYRSEEPYAYFRDGKVYICNSRTIERIRDDSTNDIYIIDERTAKDPNIRICNSYEEIDPFAMIKILRILLNYESKYPSEWNRSLISMLLEWMGHNIGYYFDVETHRTAEVDLNNKDEYKYSLLNKK